MMKTITLRLDMPSDRTLHITLPPDIPAGPLEVVLVIAPTPTASLEGRWQAYFPVGFDIDDALYEIRHGWEKEWLADEDE